MEFVTKQAQTAEHPKKVTGKNRRKRGSAPFLQTGLTP
jgi:hypothetical protein